ncbi:tRNA dimethylallyltransferase [Enhygromyxa salina]|uniref:tRNA dimethylallyltransferase n=1 Tax=Enhygromyxa salina TaxID=215803 RepID=A0A2S9XXF3_9BACT|nr:tRNA (adenosine(37)-N6)-dimethylallyltransferase MiaA [Enhygromyxa salina]PRP97410.1 tRNA dimethylallyltransferase [Enhygromyxa salina]
MASDNNEAKRPRAVAIVGPTAAGKSSLALSLASSLGVPILSCDSVQVYRGLDIGSAKPSADDRARVVHKLLDLVDPDQEFSAGQYGELARAELAGGPAIFCGGTGLYLRAAGWTHSGEACSSDRSEANEPARVRFETLWMARETSDAGALHRELATRDPETAAGIHPHNLVRALRALWLCEKHEEPISAVRRRDPPRPKLELLMIVLDPGVGGVDAAIERRCEAMLTRGWVAEVEKLLAAGYDARHKAMRSLGYRELVEHIEGRCTLNQATTAIKRATRKYARRQRTYFRHQFRGLLPMERIFNIDHPDACPVARVEAFLAGEPT